MAGLHHLSPANERDYPRLPAMARQVARWLAPTSVTVHNNKNTIIITPPPDTTNRCINEGPQPMKPGLHSSLLLTPIRQHPPHKNNILFIVLARTINVYTCLSVSLLHRGAGGGGEGRCGASSCTLEADVQQGLLGSKSHCG